MAAFSQKKPANEENNIKYHTLDIKLYFKYTALYRLFHLMHCVGI